jgi:hypothetical protein
MKVRDAIAQLGIDAATVPGELCLVAITKSGARHYTLAQVADREVTKDLYLATGTFAPGSISEYAGRIADNLTSILWLIGDFDFKDYLEGVTLEQLRTWPDGDLLTTARALAQDVRELYELIGIPVHRIDYTGYGIAVYTCLNGHATADIPELRDLNRALVETINARWGSTLADPGVHDAGTRIMRLVPGLNTKGPTPRQAQTIFKADGHVSVDTLRTTLQTRPRATVGRAIPRTGSLLPASVLHDLIDAIGSHWTEGKRHGLALAVAGILAKASVPEEQALALIEHIAIATGDGEIEDRRKAVATSYARARNGLETRGLFGLRDWLPIETVEWIDRTLEEVRPRIAEMTFTARDGVVADDVVDNNIPVAPLPEVVKAGLIGEYIELMAPTSEASESFHLGVGLTVAGAIMGRHVRVNFSGPLYGNLFTLLVGVSGRSRKDTAIRRGRDFMWQSFSDGTVQRYIPVSVLTDIASSEGLLGALENQPNILLYLTELSKLMAKGRRESTRTIFGTLMEAFDTPPRMMNLSLKSKIVAENPYLSILSATQPKILEDLMSDAEVYSGFINRWLIIPGEPRGSIAWPPPVDAQISALLLERMHKSIFDGFPEHAELTLSADARSFWSDWYDADHAVARTEDEGAMRGRYATLIVKVALIYAVLDGEHLLTRAHLERGIALIEWMWGHVARMLPEWGGVKDGRIEAKILKLLTERGPMRKRDLQSYCKSRTWGPVDFHRVFDAMVHNTVLGVDAKGVVVIRND